MDLNKLYELHLAGEKPRLVVIPTFRFYRPVLTTRLIESCDVIKKLSYKKKQGSLNTEVFACQKKQNHTKFNHLPIILLHDSSPWEEANCYLMSLIENTHKFEALPSYQQLYRKALSIKGFSEFIVAEKINFKECKSRAKSPLRRYRFMLNEKMKIREISANTIKVTMLNLVSFYRYLIKTEKIKFQYPPWDEKERYIQYRGQSGNYINHRVISSDVSQVHGIKHANIKNAAFEGKIIDGGTLRPLSIDEQKTLIFTLKEVGSIEMTLVHLHGLITGVFQGSCRLSC
ncbi:hypothetical protein [Shewanella frigidimarina]|uniref:hypothetical protein n=1 Tax=Shewanella frigidimarina TaxID=56812 RepID=UPI003D7BB609